jgi:hypothetical protein
MKRDVENYLLEWKRGNSSNELLIVDLLEEM